MVFAVADVVVLATAAAVVALVNRPGNPNGQRLPLRVVPVLPVAGRWPEVTGRSARTVDNRRVPVDRCETNVIIIVLDFTRHDCV